MENSEKVPQKLKTEWHYPAIPDLAYIQRKCNLSVKQKSPMFITELNSSPKMQST